MMLPASRFQVTVRLCSATSDPAADHCSDRLPTVTASAALEELSHDESLHISTGLRELDKHLQDGLGAPNNTPGSGGIKRGQVAEVWGPPGTGKTALG